MDKVLIDLSATRGGVSIISFTTVKTRNKKKKRDEIIVLAKSKLNSIEYLVSQALIDIEISHEEFITILYKKEKYEKMKKNIRTVKSSDKLNKIKTTEL